MELTNEFEVAVTRDDAWKVLTDLERIAPCLPGAQLQEVEGDEYRGTVKVKVGPITTSYKGVASFSELDAEGYRAVLKAEGRETRGQGNASAVITAQLTDAGAGKTRVSVVTDLNITGKVAQFGRGVLGEVSSKLLEQFAENLEAMVLAPGGDATATAAAPAPDPDPEPKPAPAKAPRSRKAAAPKSVAEPETTEAAKPTPAPASASASASEPAPAPEPAPTVRRIDSRPAEPVDLVEIAGPSLRKRILPYASIAGGIFLLRIVIYALRRRKK